MKLILFTCLLVFTQGRVNAQTQVEINLQTAAELKKADAEMTKAYKEAMSYQDEKGKKLLLEAQRAWIKYKEAHCRSAANSMEGGSGHPQAMNTCMAALTKARTAELYELFEDRD